MDQLTALNVFKRVVEFQSFSAAARDIGLSNAAVSKNVSELEKHLGVRLLTRTTRRLSVTEAGERYYQRCVRILDDLDEAGVEAAGLTSKPSGTLKVVAPLSLGLAHLSPALPHYLKQFPDVALELDLNMSISDLANKDFDVAIRAGGTLSDSSLISRTLAPMNLVLCAAPDYLAKHGTPTSPEDLTEHNCVLNSQYSAAREWVFTRNGEQTSVAVTGRFRANGSIAMTDVLVQGVGIGLMPQFLINDDLRSGRLISLLEAWNTNPLNIFATYHHRQYVPAKVRSFIDFLAEYYEKHSDFADDKR